MADQVHHIGPGQGVPVRLRRSSRARRMTLRVSHLRGEVTLTLPRHVAAVDGLQFAESKLDWVRKHLARTAQVQPIKPGSVLPFLGQPHRLVAAPDRKTPHLQDGEIHVTQDRMAKRLAAWLREEARRETSHHAGRYAAKLGKPYSKLVISDTKSRWGSCSSRGRLMFSFRLVMAPPDVLDYVVAHEVAHLAEMNHGPRFWALCAQLYGDYQTPRAWLKTEGSALHRYRFEEAEV